MKIHAIQTGSVRIKTAQVEGRGRGLRRRLAVLNDRQWTHQGTTYFLAGDASYDQHLMLAGRIDGISADDDVAGATLRAIRQFARSRRVVYLPTHDPESAARLAGRACVPSSHL